MISRLRGTLETVTDQSALVENRGIFYEVLVPSGLAERLKERVATGTEITFETIYYVEAGSRQANQFPRLIGFVDPIDREFFSLLIQVPGLGMKKALKSLVLPIREIALSIENKDARSLAKLPGIGARLAEKIVAELHGKTAKFALSKAEEPLAKLGGPIPAVPLATEALEVLLQLQYRRQEAEDMIRAALKMRPEIEKVEELIQIIFRNEQKAAGV